MLLEKNVLKILYTFTLDITFEITLFTSPHLSGNALYAQEKKHNGLILHHSRILIRMSKQTHVDVSYSVMKLSSYMWSPRAACFRLLHHLMGYLYHHPHIPIFYRLLVSPPYPMNPTLQGWFGKEINDPRGSYIPKMEPYCDADIYRDLLDRRFYTSYINIFCACLVSWIVQKQANTALCNNGFEVHSLFTTIIRSNEISSLASFLGHTSINPELYK